jgi:Sigma-70 region 2
MVNSCLPFRTALASVVAWDFRPPSKPQQSETELIRAIAQGDKRAMHVLFAQHRLRVYRFALRLIEEKEAAEDLVSEAFLNVWRHAGRFEGALLIHPH